MGRRKRDEQLTFPWASPPPERRRLEPETMTRHPSDTNDPNSSYACSETQPPTLQDQEGDR